MSTKRHESRERFRARISFAHQYVGISTEQHLVYCEEEVFTKSNISRYFPENRNLTPNLHHILPIMRASLAYRPRPAQTRLPGSPHNELNLIVAELASLDERVRRFLLAERPCRNAASIRTRLLVGRVSRRGFDEEGL
jgi:hypothetical protein